jgi:hypothetical protein
MSGSSSNTQLWEALELARELVDWADSGPGFTPGDEIPEMQIIRDNTVRVCRALLTRQSENLESARDPDTGILRADLAAVAERVYERLFAELRQRGIILPGCDTTDKALVVIEQWAQAELSPKSAREIVGKNMMQALREQHQIDKAQRRCQHLWPHADRPMPASWECACGAKVYRSYEDAVDD